MKEFDMRKEELLRVMGDLSEDAYCAGWMAGLEQACKDIVSGKLASYGMVSGKDFEYYKNKLTELHDWLKGWWYFGDFGGAGFEYVFALDEDYKSLDL